jgi:hypothetical protein
MFNIRMIMLGRKARLVMNGKKMEALKDIIGHAKRFSKAILLAGGPQ